LSSWKDSIRDPDFSDIYKLDSGQKPAGMSCTLKIDTNKSMTYISLKTIRHMYSEAIMQTKLTLRLEDQLIEQAKSYAAHAGKSVSQIVAEYFKLLTSQKITINSPSAPITQSLRGLLRESTLDEKDYKKYLEEKHL